MPRAIVKCVRRNTAEDEETQPKKMSRVDTSPIHEHGSGTPRDPFWLPLRTTPNASGCLFCPSPTCHCHLLSETLARCYESLTTKRQIETHRRRDLCAKSVLPPFVSRLIRIANLQPHETFYDFGCGNGSVVFQVAAMTGCRCVGVEINPRNAEVASEAWQVLQPQLERRFNRRLNVEIVCADMCELMRPTTFFGTTSCVIWAANLLLPRPVNHYLSERFREVPSGTRILCFEDLYPHGRSLAKIRDPDAFAKFDMTDYRWQPGTVEWCVMAGSFYLYTKKATMNAS